MKTELITTDYRTAVYYENDSLSIEDLVAFTKSETIELRDFLNQLDLTD